MKLASYNDRASAFEAELTRGNLSLSIRNVTYTDRGMYRCFVPSLRNHVIIQLVVGKKSLFLIPSQNGKV